MSALAKFILASGKTVGGSDIVDSVYTQELKGLGVSVETGDRRGSVKNYDVVVYTDAISKNDVQISEAVALNKKILSRGQLLYEISKKFKKVIAVSGCHGKTTCTSMLAHVFLCANKNFCTHIGGRDKKFSNFYVNGYDYFITEACEYKKNFLLLKPDVSVILNSDPDHLECYGSYENLREAYMTFAQNADNTITLYGDFDIESVTFGMDKGANYCAKELTCKDEKYEFKAYCGNVLLGTVKLNVYGKHNVLNALAVIATARTVEIPFESIASGIADFSGVERRFENIGSVNGAVCIADYAHHPNEILATLQAARKLTSGKLITVFQPHTYSRTKNLFKDFVEVLSPLNNLLIYRTFAAREYFDDTGSALTLSQAVKRSRYGDCLGDIEEFISVAEEGDVILFLGAGDIYEIAKEIVTNMQN